MSVQSSIYITSALVFGLILLLGGCGGNSSAVSDPGSPSVAGGPIVEPQSDDNCEPSASALCNIVAGNAAKTAFVTSESRHIYTIPAGSQIVLSTVEGDADLYLYPNQNFSNEDILCSARLGFIEDICSDDDARYALVYGREDSTYTISATYDCSVPSQNRWVDRQMRDYYLFYDQVPGLNLDSYNSPEALIADLRVAEFDSFSSIRDTAVVNQLFNEGTAFGMGFRLLRDADGLPRIARVYENSPMGLANIKRSDIVVSINGIPWDNIDSSRYHELVGTTDNPQPTTWVFRDSATNDTRQVELTQSRYNLNTVVYAQTINYPGYNGKIGYLVFESFLSPSEAELDRVLDEFMRDGVTDLILDMRYNGGGLTRIARKLMSQIAGPDTDGELLIEYQHNDRYQAFNFERNFEPQSINLDLKRLVVITTGSTASASEIVINSLRPYIDVVTVGTRTTGKPYISFSRDFCGKSISAMSAQGVNASGVSVFGGIAADCVASDDLTRDFGVSDGSIEGLVRSAAEYLVFGRCDVGTQTKLDSEYSDPAWLLSYDEMSLPGAVGF